MTAARTTRDPQLRRSDWRFLLPDPQPERVACDDQETAAVLVAVGAAVRRSADPEARECDLAVVTRPAAADLRRAYVVLRPGGVCYAEWTGVFDTPGRVRRRLERAGFTNVRCYWPWPSIARADVWIPLAPLVAARYYFRQHRPPSRRPTRRALQIVRHAVAFARVRLGLARPVCATGVRPLLQAESTRTPAGRKSWWFAHPDGPASSAEHAAPHLDDSPLILTGGPRAVARVVALGGWSPGTTWPTVAVKTTRVPGTAPGLRRETEILQRLAGLPATRGVPRPLFRRTTRLGEPVAAESAVRGLPLESALTRATFRPLATRATDWLAALAVHERGRVDSLERISGPALERFVREFGRVADPALVAYTRRVLATAPALPVVLEHRDFSPWNVFVAPDGGLEVLDWETGVTDGVPLLDLLYFLANLSFVLDGVLGNQRYRASYRRSLDPQTLTGSVRRDCVSRYVAALGLDPRAVPPLRLLLWVLHAHSEYARLAEIARGTPSPALLASSALLPLWEEEVADLRAGRENQHEIFPTCS